MNPMDTLDRLVDRLFDYAGMFPPAALEFDHALAQAARHDERLKRPHMVDADMVVKPEHLPRLTDDAMKGAAWEPGRTCTIALVGVPLDRAREAAESIKRFNDTHAQSDVVRRVISLEPATPSRLDDDADAVRESLLDIQKATPQGTRLFLEPRWDVETWKTSGPGLFALLEKVGDVGLKIRCAGDTAITHDIMADVLEQTVRRGIPLKATQGLHHPILEKRWDNPWGFLNVVAALRYLGALEGDFPRDETLRLLGEDDANAFSFENGLQWRDHSLSPAALERAAQTAPFSIGSCNVQEADDDLTRLFG